MSYAYRRSACLIMTCWILTTSLAASASRNCKQKPHGTVCTQALSMILFDYDMLDPDDEIGRISLPIKDFEEQKHHDMWVEVYDPAAQKENQSAPKV